MVQDENLLLLSVSFFHQSYHETLIKAENNDEPNPKNVPKVPIILFYSTETKSTIKFEIRDSADPGESVMELIELPEISMENPLKFFQIEQKFTMDKDCLQIEKVYLYYWYNGSKLTTREFNKNDLRGQSLDYLESISNSVGKGHENLKYY